MEPSGRIRVVSAELVRQGHYLLTQRKPDAVLPLLWEFPGGRVRDGEGDEAALARCLRDRLGLDVRVGRQMMEVVHQYDGYGVTLAVYQCQAPDEQEPEPLRVHDVAWVRPEEFGRYTFPGADQHTVDLLLRASE